MSYELIKSITFKKDGVYFRSASSNCTPKMYYSERAKWYSDTLLEKGKDIVIKEILWSFSTGNYKSSGSNANIKYYSDVAHKVSQTDRYAELDNIYWEWDDVKRTPAQKEEALSEIKELLFEEYLKNKVEEQPVI